MTYLAGFDYYEFTLIGETVEGYAVLDGKTEYFIKKMDNYVYEENRGFNKDGTEWVGLQVHEGYAGTLGLLW